MSTYIKNFGECNNFKYVDSSGIVHDIKSIFYGPALVWPQEYRAVLSTNISSYSVSASGGSVNVSWTLTVYYPNSDVIIDGPRTIPSNQISGVEIYVRKEGSVAYQQVTDSSSTYTGGNNAGTWAFASRGTNGLGSSGYDTPAADGPWYYKISGNVNYTINGKTYTAVYWSKDTEIVTVARNSCSRTGVTDINNVNFNIYNKKTNNIVEELNTQSKPASYNISSVYPTIGGTLGIQYKFDSNEYYVLLDSSPTSYIENSSFSLPSWISIPSTWSTLRVEANPNSSLRYDTVTLHIGGGTKSYTVYQEGDPNAATNP